MSGRRNGSKPKSPRGGRGDADRQRSAAVAAVAVQAASALAADSPDRPYDVIRAVVILGIACAFEKAYGMASAPIEARLRNVSDDTRRAFVGAVRSLDYAALTPEHFGSAHEVLVVHTLRDGRIVPTGTRTSAHFTPRSLTEPIVARTLAPLFELVPPERTLELRICDPACGAGAFLVELVRQLGARVLAAGGASSLEEAKRLAAIHCAYGCDKDPWGVACAKIALGLECRADAMPPEWLDDNIHHGDALVGLSHRQIAAMTWGPTAKGTSEKPTATEALIEEAMNVGVAARRLRMSEFSAAARGHVR